MEKILKILGSESEVYLCNGNLNEQGYEAYSKLVDILCELRRIGIITEQIDECEKKFAEIISMGF
ncbi:MAG: hypothetical protein IJF37_09295 [Lachnospiraceae bacterium]|nr:hypothetical protein [Lachnospiraceae bacterium]